MTDLIIDNTTVTLSGIQTFDTVEIKNNGVLKVVPYDGTPTSGMLEIHAKSINIDATSMIIADAIGYRGQSSISGCGEGPGAGCNSGWAGPGAGYGGNGGNGGNGGSGGPSYGTLDGTDIAEGSGGGCSVYFSDNGAGGNGGGAISLYANNIIIDGIVTANGGDGITNNHGSGGGSGGGLLLNANNIKLSGYLNANGGNGSNPISTDNRGGGGGGGGGRIKIFYTTAYTNTGIISYIGGTGGSGSITQYDGQKGQDGTINIIQLAPPAPVLTTIIISPSNTNIPVGGTQAFTATPMDQNSNIMAGITIVWDSSDSSIASISPITGTSTVTGTLTTLTGIKPGNVTITATSGIVSGSATATIIPPVQAGFGIAGMVLIAGLAVGAVYLAYKKKKHSIW